MRPVLVAIARSFGFVGDTAIVEIQLPAPNVLFVLSGTKLPGDRAVGAGAVSTIQRRIVRVATAVAVDSATVERAQDPVRAHEDRAWLARGDDVRLVGERRGRVLLVVVVGLSVIVLPKSW